MRNSDETKKEIITLEQANKDLQKIVGLKVSRTWKGYGSAIFLELGELHKEYQGWVNKDDGKTYTLKGEWTLWSDGGWFLLKDNNIIVDGLEIERERIEQEIDQLDGTRITAFKISDNMSNVQFTFDKGTILQFNKESFGFCGLNYNHNPFLVFDDEKEEVYYENNKL